MGSLWSSPATVLELPAKQAASQISHKFQQSAADAQPDPVWLHAAALRFPADPALNPSSEPVVAVLLAGMVMGVMGLLLFGSGRSIRGVVCSVFSLIAAVWVLVHTQIAYCVQTGGHVRDRPSLKAAALHSLQPAQDLQLSNCRDGWCQVLTEQGRGYYPADWIFPLPLGVDSGL